MMMPASVECPFTLVQFKELERQALIFNHMMASVPIPPDLLFPLPLKNLSDSTVAAVLASSLSPHHRGRRTKEDPEIGRCRRTDGKKWRCANGVVAKHSYCERHLKKRQPRSRKPVEEEHLMKNPRSLQCGSNTASVAFPSPFSESSPNYCKKLSFPFDLPSIAPAAAFVSASSDSKSPDWLVREGRRVPAFASNQKWHSSVYNNADVDDSIYSHQRYQKDLTDYNAYAHFMASGENQMEEYPMFICPEKPVRGFFDAFSSEDTDDTAADVVDKNESSLSSSNTKLSLSDHGSGLTLSMAMGSSDTNDDAVDPKTGGDCQSSSWVPGGPLAEVLRPSSIAHIVDLRNPKGTRPSSLTRDLHRMVGSVSDSGCSSRSLATQM